MAKWDELMTEFREVIGNKPLNKEEIEQLIYKQGFNSSYYFRQFREQCMEIAKECGLSSEQLALVSAAINSGLEKEYTRTHFQSEEYYLDQLEEFFRRAELEVDTSTKVCSECAMAFYALAWYGFKEKDIAEIRKSDLLHDKNAVLFQGHEIPISPRAMEILLLYASSEGYYRHGTKGILLFYHYEESEYLFRTNRKAMMDSVAFRNMRKYINIMAEEISFPHRFRYEQNSINGILLRLYEWEKESGINLTPARTKNMEIVESIFGEWHHALPDLYTIVAKYYQEFCRWMENRIEKE